MDPKYIRTEDGSLWRVCDCRLYEPMQMVVDEVSKDIKFILPRMAASAGTQAHCICVLEERGAMASMRVPPLLLLPIDMVMADGHEPVPYPPEARAAIEAFGG